MKLTEDQLLLRESKKIVEALGKTFAPLVEFVLHDLTQPEHAIAAISNNLSGREVGEPATELGLSRIADPNFPEVILNYPNQFPDGRPAKSTSIGLKNSKGEFIGALCLNMDISLFSAVSASLSQLTQTTPTEIQESLASPRLEMLRTQLEQFAAAHNTTPRALNSAQRREIVRQLAQAGLMDLKNAQTVVANNLGVARSTVYTYLPTEGN
ncbi:helix-turn-helix transcriptional regulator [Yersinia enterocolitica]|uniref:helix-turn-helix transcriptional regulator n=1 Tax=Yersinia enterocolitica TaxID=630 RepID=UPI003F47F72A